MSESTDRQAQPSGRSVEVFVFGDTAAEIEMAALGEARPFFGDDLILSVVPSYRAFKDHPGGPGRKYHATVTVQAIKLEERS